MRGYEEFCGVLHERRMACCLRDLAASLLLASSVVACGGTVEVDDTPSFATLALRTRIVSTDELLLNTITGIAATSDFVYVGQQDLQGILVFRSDGEYVKTIGRNGAGPGEFRLLARFGLSGDTLWTTDWGLRRVTKFSDSGLVVDQWTLGSLSSPEAQGRNWFSFMPEVLTADGGMLGFGGVYGRTLVDGVVDSVPVLRAPARGGAADTIAWYSIANANLIIRFSRGASLRLQPIEAYAFAVYDGPGSKACMVDRDRLVRPRVAQVAITCLNTAGDTLWKRALEFEARLISLATADSVRNEAYDRFGGGWYTDDEINAAVYIPTHWPPVTHALAGADGSIWLRGVAEMDSVTYTVLDSSGEVRASVRTPLRVRVLWANGETIWAEELDEDDVPTLSRYQMLFTGGESQ